VGNVAGVDAALALVTRMGGVLFVRVREVDGALVDVESGEVLEPVDVVVVLGLPELASV
jgi:hypothetical protein